MANSKDSSLQVAAIVASLLVVVGGAWVFLNNRGDHSVESVASSETAEVTGFNSDEIKKDKDAISVDSALQMAELAFQSGELVGSEESAVYFYQKALDQDPQNVRATTGLELIGIQLADEANDLMANKDFSAVARRIEDLKELGVAMDVVAGLEETILNESKVMFASLDTAIEGGSFDEAERLLEKLGQISLADQGRLNSAIVLLAKKRKDFENQQLAQQAQQAEAELAAELAQEQAAQHAVRQAAQDKIQIQQQAAAEAAAIAEQQQAQAAQKQERENKVQALLITAKLRVDENRLLTPAGDSAADLYKQVLQQDEGNSEAKRGLRSLVQKMTSRAYQAADANNWTDAEDALSQAESLGIAENLIQQTRADILEKQLVVEADKVIHIDELEVEKTVTPVYPKRAVARSIEGWVKVEFVVSETGETTDLKIVESSERLAASFQKAATRAIEQWRFKPRVIQGKVVRQRSQTTVNFRLQE